VLRGRLGHPFKAAQLLARVLLHLFRHVGFGNRLAELGDLRLVLFAQLPADGRQLLPQQHLALTLLDRGLGLPADLRDRRRTSMRCASSFETFSMRAVTSMVSRISCFSSGFTSM
jgi:hypothetical protein